ncbi:MAG: flagellar hook-basal body complex protein FliE [Oscillospiraceae bacterium]|nr:flagellar hook-basal body complex protein FliE [Oscillospiraceae bacterium]
MVQIAPLWDSMPLDPRFQAGKVSGDIKNPFTDIFQSAIAAVRETDAEKTELEYLMSTGQLDNPVELVLAANKAQLSVSLMTQLRSKAMESYNELMRISI